MQLNRIHMSDDVSHHHRNRWHFSLLVLCDQETLDNTAFLSLLTDKVALSHSFGHKQSLLYFTVICQSKIETSTSKLRFREGNKFANTNTHKQIIHIYIQSKYFHYDNIIKMLNMQRIISGHDSYLLLSNISEDHSFLMPH